MFLWSDIVRCLCLYTYIYIYIYVYVYIYVISTYNQIQYAILIVQPMILNQIPLYSFSVSRGPVCWFISLLHIYIYIYHSIYVQEYDCICIQCIVYCAWKKSCTIWKLQVPTKHLTNWDCNGINRGKPWKNCCRSSSIHSILATLWFCQNS